MDEIIEKLDNIGNNYGELIKKFDSISSLFFMFCFK